VIQIKKTILLASLIATSYSLSAQEIRLSLDPDSVHQAIHSFAASDAWSAQYIGKFYPDHKKEQIAEWLFSKELDEKGNPKGIGLSLWRFNIGSGGVHLGDSSMISWNWRRSECFMNPDGSYDWNRQEGQRWFLDKALEYGVENIKAFLYSPPYFMTRNNRTISSPKDKIHMNIKPGHLGAYASFIGEVLDHFKQQGIEFNYLSPFNEPEWDWSNGLAEGTPATNDELYLLMRYINAELELRGLSTKMVIGECGDLRYMYGKHLGDRSMNEKIKSFCSPQSPTYIGALSHVEPAISAHSYHTVWPVDTLIHSRQQVMKRLWAVNPDFSFWQTEYCILQENEDIGTGWDRDLGMNTALYIARIIHYDLTHANASSWSWWTAISQMDYKSGLIYLDNENKGSRGPHDDDYESLKYDGQIRHSKTMWVLGNYSRFVRPGMVRIESGIEAENELAGIVESYMVSAYKDPENSRMVAVFVNDKHQAIRLKIPEGATKMYLTSESENLAPEPVYGREVRIPQRSVATLIFDVDPAN
jgi:O-glycosyl hydrolase